MKKRETFHGDNWWAQYESEAYISRLCKRTSDVLSTEVTKRLASFGAYMMRAIGEMVNADADSLEALYDLMEEKHEKRTWGGLALGNSMNEYSNVLRYLIAPESEKDWYREEATFFLQLCATFASARDTQELREESMPMLVGDVHPDSKEVTLWHGWAPWEEDPEKKHRTYLSMEEWWYETFPEDRPEGGE